ncbi:hypothetical protein ACQKJ1_28440, partial [Methylorubrum rhodesianum]
LGHGWLLSLRRQHPDYARTQSREQEPSTPSIELVFAKLKAILRADAARTVSELWDTIKLAFRRFSMAECRNYLAAAGYDAYDPI